MSRPPLSVCVCTRERPEQLRRCLGALLDDLPADVPVVVVEQGRPGEALDPRVTVIRDEGRGLSRARNLAWRATDSAWVAFVDDDCRVLAGWSAALLDALGEHPEAAFVSGDVAGAQSPAAAGVEVTTFEVRERAVRAGRWTRPWEIGFGVCMVVRRDWIERLGGWDEQLGPGVTDAPAADDMDFNFRLLRAGGIAVATPDMRAVHEQWRDPAAVARLHGGYATAWSVFAMKTLRQGDVPGALWLWTWGPYDAAKMLASALRRRSRLRARIAAALAAGHARGTVRGLRRALR